MPRQNIPGLQLCLCWIFTCVPLISYSLLERFLPLVHVCASARSHQVFYEALIHVIGQSLSLDSGTGPEELEGFSSSCLCASASRKLKINKINNKVILCSIIIN